MYCRSCTLLEVFFYFIFIRLPIIILILLLIPSFYIMHQNVWQKENPWNIFLRKIWTWTWKYLNLHMVPSKGNVEAVFIMWSFCNFFSFFARFNSPIIYDVLNSFSYKSQNNLGFFASIDQWVWCVQKKSFCQNWKQMSVQGVSNRKLGILEIKKYQTKIKYMLICINIFIGKIYL